MKTKARPILTDEQQVLEKIDLDGSLLTADALSTPAKTARIVQQKGGDYLFTVKGHQPGIEKNVHQLFQGLKRAFFPSADNFHRAEL